MPNNDKKPDQVHLQEEMLLRGFSEVLAEDGSRREYAEAYDAFLDEHDLNGFVRNKPENVQRAFMDVMAGDADGR